LIVAFKVWQQRLLSSPSPLSSSPASQLLAWSSCAHWLPPSLVDCYFFNDGQSQGNVFVIIIVLCYKLLCTHENAIFLCVRTISPSG
jgi:hypothetical protein